tara:strand:- start:220 stop:825 length:606 start_codon:yes stop_codon:yes gene_type:complete
MSFRKEEKLSLNPRKYKEFLSLISDKNGSTLFPDRVVSSTYFDNESFQMYHDSNEGVVPRKKIRVRSYNLDQHSQSNSKLEIKISSVENRFKTVSNKGLSNNIFLRGYLDANYGLCFPKVRITYERSYYLVNGLRLTIDKNINYKKAIKGTSSSIIVKDDLIIVEVKTDVSTSDHKIFMNFPLEKIRFSKYSRAIEFLKVL